MGRTQESVLPSLKLYLLFHFAGIVGSCMTIAGLAGHAMYGGTKESAGGTRKALMAAHGIFMFLVLLGGMGAGTQIGAISSETGFASWIHVKLAIWLFVGGIVALPYRLGKNAIWLFVAVPLIIAFAGWTAGGFLPLTR